MKTTRIIHALIATLAFCATARAQSTAFTYQGFLTENGGPVNGPAEVQFTLWDADSAGTQIAVTAPAVTVVAVTNGLFTATLDFGGGAFNGQPRFIQLAVRTTIGPLTPVAPRQRIATVPYAIRSASVASDGIGGSYSSAVNFNNAGNSFSGTFTGDGASLSNINVATVGGVAASNLWKVGGNAGANPAAGAFLGTTDSQPLELRVNGQRALRVEPNTNGAPNLIGGAALNSVGLDVAGATIAGGGATDWFGTSHSNTILSSFGSIGGGRGHFIDVFSLHGLIGGGESNTIATELQYGTIGGGLRNRLGPFSSGSTISGGRDNAISTNADLSTISGGSRHTIGTQAGDSVIGGGRTNTIRNGADGSTISGGVDNSIGVNTFYGTIGGGSGNAISNDSYSSIIAGGINNTIGSDANNSTISGGVGNGIGIVSRSSTIGGGFLNKVGTNSIASLIGGGRDNIIANNAPNATIAGGIQNYATNFAFAAGNRAKATNTGAFVWGDSSNSDVISTNNNSVTFRASGGYRLFSSASSTAPAPGVFLAPGASAWGTISDRDSKKDLTPVDGQAVLEALAQVPVQRWHYEWEETSATPHLGPMAQDFKAAFYPGRDDKSITTLEFDGVALAAIQGLNAKLEAKIEQKESEITELKKRLSALERLVIGGAGRAGVAGSNE